MSWNLKGTTANEGDLALLVGLRHKHFIVKLKVGGTLHTHRGIVSHDDLVGKPWGSYIQSHNGAPFYLLQPALADILRSLKRRTQILYPKDIGFILVMMGIGPGQTVLEAGTGSGSLTSAMAFAVGNEGRIISYDARPEFQRIAKRNLERLGLIDRVTLKQGNVADGFDETDVDSVFLDLPNPYDYMDQVRGALKNGGFFGTILPTTNQVTLLLESFRLHNFAFVEVCEILLRFYRAEVHKLRPTDRMVAHTGYLIFARPVEASTKDIEAAGDQEDMDAGEIIDPEDTLD